MIEYDSGQINRCCGFGEINQNNKSIETKYKISRIAETIFCIGVTCLVGAFLASANPLILPLAFATPVIYFLSKKIHSLVTSYRFKLELSEDIRHLHENGTPPLGTACLADLRVSNHALESFEWKKQLINEASETIECSFNFGGGEPFREILTVIEERMEVVSHLNVHLIVSEDLLQKEDEKKIADLQKRYSERFHCLITKRYYTSDVFFHSEENHVKLLIVDGRYFVIGGTGVSKSMSRQESMEDEEERCSFKENLLDKGFCDTDIIGRSRVDNNIAASMRAQFYNLYHIWAQRIGHTLLSTEGKMIAIHPEKASHSLFDQEEGLIQNSNLKFLVGGPEHRGNNPIENEYINRIYQAQESVVFGNLCFNPRNNLKQAFRNVKVEVCGIFNGSKKGAFDSHKIYTIPNRYNYRLLDRAYEYSAENQLYHKKVMVIDSKSAIIGSYNLGVKSAICDYESVVVIDDSRVANIVMDGLQEDIKKSKPYSDSIKSNKKSIGKLLSNLMIAPFFG